MNRRALLKSLIASPALYLASRYGLPNGEAFDEGAFYLNVESNFFDVVGADKHTYLPAHQHILKVIKVISPTKALVKPVENIDA